MGEAILLVMALIEGAGVVLIHYSTTLYPPILLIALTIAVACIGIWLHSLVTKQSLFAFPRSAWRDVFGVALCIVIIPMPIWYVGTSLSSSINTALLNPAQVVFAFLYGALFFGERIKWRHVLGAISVIVGIGFVVYKGADAVNIGDVLMLLAHAIFPFGNNYAKRALNVMTPLQLIFWRYALGVGFLLLFSYVFEQWPSVEHMIAWSNAWTIVIAGIVIYVLAKICFYVGLPLAGVARSTAIFSASPAFTLLTVFVIFGTRPSVTQWCGFVLTMVGSYLVINWGNTGRNLANTQT